MSKPAAANPFIAKNPFADNEFTKYFDVSKVFDMAKTLEMPKAFQDFKMPTNLGMESLMDAQRKNFQALAAANQTAMECAQGMMRRQSELMRQSMQEGSELLSQVTASSTPEDKLAKQTAMTKAIFDRCMVNSKEMTEMAAQAQYQAMEVLSNRMGECLEEMRGACRSTGKVPANK